MELPLTVTACILEQEIGFHLAEEGGLGETAAVQIAVAAQPTGPESLLPEPLSRSP